MKTITLIEQPGPMAIVCKVLGEHIIRDASDTIDGEFEYTHRIILPKGQRPTPEICRELARSFSFGCHCSHDCCGHMFGNSVIAPTSRPRELLVTVYGGRNV